MYNKRKKKQVVYKEKSDHKESNLPFHREKSNTNVTITNMLAIIFCVRRLLKK